MYKKIGKMYKKMSLKPFYLCIMKTREISVSLLFV